MFRSLYFTIVTFKVNRPILSKYQEQILVLSQENLIERTRDK